MLEVVTSRELWGWLLVLLVLVTVLSWRECKIAEGHNLLVFPSMRTHYQGCRRIFRGSLVICVVLTIILMKGVL